MFPVVSSIHPATLPGNSKDVQHKERQSERNKTWRKDIKLGMPGETKMMTETVSWRPDENEMLRMDNKAECQPHVFLDDLKSVARLSLAVVIQDFFFPDEMKGHCWPSQSQLCLDLL